MPIKADWVEFKIENIRALPSDLIGVYECGCKKGNKVLYIGKGAVRARLLDHVEKKRFLDSVTHFRKRKTIDSDAAIKAEDKLLTEYKKRCGKYPPLNKIKSPGDPWKGVLY